MIAIQIKKAFLGFFILFQLAGTTMFSQDITGIWKGYFVSDDGQYYKLEFQISNKAGYATTGVSYSYLDVRFYGKATMTGNFIRNSGRLRIKEIRTVEVKSLIGGITCIMNYELVYSKSGKEEFLEGTYLGKNEKPLSIDSSYWGDCGGGKVMLRKVETSDFYTEPFLRNKTNTSPPVARKPPVTQQKQSTTTKTSTNKPVTTKPVEKPKNTTVATTPKADSSIIVEKQPKKELTVEAPTPRILKTRTNELVKTLEVNKEEITVKLFDNGEIDDDTISVYLDKKLVLSKKRLTAVPLIIKIAMDEDNSDHELVMVAENLGRIPPNTSLMIVEAGDQRYDVRITSTEQKNALVRFRYVKPK